MCTYMYACVYISMFGCSFVCLYVYVCVCMYVLWYVCVCVCVCECVRVEEFVGLCHVDTESVTQPYTLNPKT